MGHLGRMSFSGAAVKKRGRERERKRRKKMILLETRPSMEDSCDLNERGSNIRGSNFNRAVI